MASSTFREAESAMEKAVTLVRDFGMPNKTAARAMGVSVRTMKRKIHNPTDFVRKKGQPAFLAPKEVDSLLEKIKAAAATPEPLGREGIIAAVNDLSCYNKYLYI
jgi:CRISPR/Cas system-associated endonuclease Cas1